MGGTNAKCFHVRFVAALDPGCVKTLEAIIGAQQKNRSHSLDESFMRGRPSLCTNLVPERPIEWFSHSQDPIRTLAGQFRCDAQPYSGSPCGSPNVAHGAGARVGL